MHDDQGETRPRPLTWREFVGYIRDDRTMLRRLAILSGVAVGGLVLVTALAVWL